MRFALWGTLSAALLFSATGCRKPLKNGGEESRVAIESEARSQSGVSGVTSVRLKGSGFSGVDAKGRLLWSIGAKEIQAFNQGGGLSGMQPRRAILTQAWAKLYREGKLDSSFSSARIEYLNTPKGDRMTLTGGVQAKSAGSLAKTGGPVLLQAPHMDVDATAHRILASQGVSARRGGAQAVEVLAQQVASDTSLGVANLRGGVRVKGKQGEARADAGVWNWRTNRAQATGRVSASHDGTTITGNRLDADVAASRGTLSGNVRAVSNAGGTAQAGNVRFDWKRRILSAVGGVRLQKDGGTMTAARIDTDDKLNHATASGGVTLQKDGGTLRAARIEAFDKLNRAVASGGVVLQKDGTIVRASQVQAFDKLSRAVASGSVTMQKDGATIRAARVETSNRFQQATASGGVTLVKDDLNASASRAQVTGLGNGENAIRLVASGGVRAHNKDGAVRAARVTWGGGRVVGSGGVTLQKDGNELSGATLQSDDKFKHAVLSGNVRGRLAQRGTVAARAVNYDNGQIMARGSIVARRDNLTLRAANLQSTPDGKQVFLTGGVLVQSDDGQTIRAPSARYERASNKVYASGGVTFNDPKHGQTARGQTLVYDVKKREAYLTNATGSTSVGLLKDKKLF